MRSTKDSSDRQTMMDYTMPPSYRVLQKFLPPDRGGLHLLEAPHPSAQSSPTSGAATRPDSSYRSTRPSALMRVLKAPKVRKAVIVALCDLVKQSNEAQACAILDRCVEVCDTYALSPSSLLQKRSIEGHTPLYWAIINKPRALADGLDFVSALISTAAPLTNATVDEVRLACMHRSDQPLLQALKGLPELTPRSGKEAIIANGSGLRDVVLVEEDEDNSAAFTVQFRAPSFHTRMQAQEEIRLEFIAKGTHCRSLYPSLCSPRLTHGLLLTDDAH